ncbi:MAG: sugar phosphate isomerase/epimerase family protein [Nitrospinota bacterium]
MISISTAYWPSLEEGQKILNEVDRLGFSSIEISSYTARKPVEEILPALRRKRVRAVSVHNPCPKYEPKLLPWETERPEPEVTAGDEEERRAAVALACRTLELAADVEAEAVVLHLGTTAMSPCIDTLRQMYDRETTETDEGRERLLELAGRRARAGEEVWDALSFSLQQLTQKAERLNLLLGIENRIHLHEVPTYEEIGRILSEFDGGNFRYWHDVGHATVHQNLGLVKGEEVLAGELGKRLLGLHLHDAKGYDDHIAPGRGDAQFASLAPYLSPETLRVLEVHPRASEEDLQAGLEVLIEAGILGPNGGREG